MAGAMIESLKALKLQIENIIKQLEWAWDGQVPESERLQLVQRYELFQHTIDVHIQGSEKMLEIVIKNKVVEVPDDRQALIIGAATN